MKRYILIVEDNQDIAIILCAVLQRAGWQSHVVRQWQEVHERLRHSPPDLIILDLNLPNADGFDLCRDIRRDPKGTYIPILILSARREDSDIVAGLELGADDYLTKPINPKILLARVGALLRRSRVEIASQEQVIRYHDFVIDPHRFELRYQGEELPLTRSEFRILQLFCGAPGCVFTRAQIIEAAHGERRPVTKRSVDVLIVSLRQKLGRYGALIETVRGVGYRIKQAVQEAQEGR